MHTFVTCTVVETTEHRAFELGLALEVHLRAGTAVPADPGAPGVFSLQYLVQAESPEHALAQAIVTTALLVAEIRVPTELVEAIAIGHDGATCWIPHGISSTDVTVLGPTPTDHRT